VVTGIGHDKDISVTDMVAHTSLKTPTAVADFLIDSIAGAENHILEISSEIIKTSQAIIEKNRTRIESSGSKLFPLAQIMISDVKNRLSAGLIEIINIGKAKIIRAGLIPANQESRLASAAKSSSSGAELMLMRNIKRLNSGSNNCFSVNHLILNGVANKLQLLNPENILQRGFSITTINGRILRNCDQIVKDDLIDTQLYEGSLRSRVMDKRNRK
jgi:exodeoxyribonuclease VII large subunit